MQVETILIYISNGNTWLYSIRLTERWKKPSKALRLFIVCLLWVKQYDTLWYSGHAQTYSCKIWAHVQHVTIIFYQLHLCILPFVDITLWLWQDMNVQSQQPWCYSTELAWACLWFWLKYRPRPLNFAQLLKPCTAVLQQRVPVQLSTVYSKVLSTGEDLSEQMKHSHSQEHIPLKLKSLDLHHILTGSSLALSHPLPRFCYTPSSSCIVMQSCKPTNQQTERVKAQPPWWRSQQIQGFKHFHTPFRFFENIFWFSQHHHLV